MRSALGDPGSFAGRPGRRLAGRLTGRRRGVRGAARRGLSARSSPELRRKRCAAWGAGVWGFVVREVRACSFSWSCLHKFPPDSGHLGTPLFCLGGIFFLQSSVNFFDTSHAGSVDFHRAGGPYLGERMLPCHCGRRPGMGIKQMVSNVLRQKLRDVKQIVPQHFVARGKLQMYGFAKVGGSMGFQWSSGYSARL